MSYQQKSKTFPEKSDISPELKPSQKLSKTYQQPEKFDGIVADDLLVFLLPRGKINLREEMVMLIPTNK